MSSILFIVKTKQKAKVWIVLITYTFFWMAEWMKIGKLTFLDCCVLFNSCVLLNIWWSLALLFCALCAQLCTTRIWWSLAKLFCAFCALLWSQTQEKHWNNVHIFCHSQIYTKNCVKQWLNQWDSVSGQAKNSLWKRKS